MKVSLRTAAAALCTAAVCIAIGPVPGAAQDPKPPSGATTLPKAATQPTKPTTSPVIAHFEAKAPYEGDPGSPAKIDIMIERWSTDKERDDLSAALTKSGPEGLLNVLQGMRRRAGVLMMPGVQASGARARLRHPVNLYFARQVETAGGRQVIAASDHFLAFGQPTSAWPSDFEFSLLDIRFDKNGTGIGKVVHAAKVGENTSTKTLEAKDYGSLPARLIDVKSDKP